MSASDRVGQLLSDYRLLGLLGYGSFGDVYLAEHVYLDLPAVIKVLHTPLTTPEDQNVFVKEVSSVMLHHRHIVQIHSFGVENDIPYIVMDYTQGSLRQRHPRGTPVPLPTIISYVKQIADALQYAHERHIIHRDVKPENMLLGSKDEVLLSDFGLAVESHSSSHHRAQTVAGTLTYMAPEQLVGRPSRASDQYSLAVTVYEWLCGVPPFQGTYAEVGQQHFHSFPPSLRDKNPTIPLGIERVVLKALAKDPEERFPSVQEFANALELSSQLPPLTSPNLAEEAEITSVLEVISTVEPLKAASIDVVSDSFILPRIRSSFYAALGKILSIFGFDKEALAVYENAIRLEPHSSLFYVKKGGILFHLSRHNEALAAFDEAIRLAPESSKAYWGRGKTFEKLAQQSYDEFKQRAQQSYEKAKELGVE